MASSEARVLKTSGADVNAEVSRLRAELEGKESRLAECAAREEDLRKDLASSEGLRGEARAELAAAQAALNTGAEDFVALERRLCEAELTCERLRSGVETTEMEMSEVCVQVCVCVFVASIDRTNWLTDEQTKSVSVRLKTQTLLKATMWDPVRGHHVCVCMFVVLDCIVCYFGILVRGFWLAIGGVGVLMNG